MVVEQVSIRLDRCHIHSGNLTNISAPWSFATGLLCGITFANEHANGNTMPVHISNTKFISNYGGAVTFFVSGRSSYTCNNSAYMILVDRCEFSNNAAYFGHTAIKAGMMSDDANPRVTVQENVLKVRLIIQNSMIHHNTKLPSISSQISDVIVFFSASRSCYCKF